MSDFRLTNIIKVTSNFILDKLSPIPDVTTADFMQKLNEIYNEYNKSFPPKGYNFFHYMLHTS